MRERLEALKPVASARTQVLLAAAMWSAVGAVLLLVGADWVLWGAGPHFSPWLIAVAVLVGALKARFVLRRTAARLVERIRSRGDGRCVGGFLSLTSWMFVAAMMGMGYLLRHGLLPRTEVGLIYVAVGSALLLAATSIWRAWYRRQPCR